jgi:hypothetical protein
VALRANSEIFSGMTLLYVQSIPLYTIRYDLL